ncbi:helix-turn-helix transcriptional regulator [Parvularcula flava]|uniref:Helix-turn-helix transcriptional regulator n=1 Tax=Aquisalinus luteolus TaxID=1566827 RepID=A0A8J3A2S6_9PROT|nr:AraC family transcriptional regulator [Aquisalinus luteolus]NHK27176.1 helix-turn-helix transcriptional regulator [Aquisalinus luteolus]GGH94627.1 hypothetical protein GCM10011355_09260 [Aquisalinus luteolus]
MAGHRWRDNELIDFAGTGSSRGFVPSARLEAGGVTLARGQLAANDGVALGAAQITIAVIESACVSLEWYPPGTDPQRHFLLPNSAQILSAGRPCRSRWAGRPTILAVAFDDALIEQLRIETGLQDETPVGSRLGLRDPDIDTIIAKLRLELDFGGWSGRGFLASIGIVLAVHLLRHYRGGRPAHTSGGLSDRRLRRVAGFIETHLGDEINQAELAGLAALSPHHFASAFRRSAGVAPHRYVLERRIAHARALLAGSEATITTIAHGLGFASHGHFSESFRRMVGVTPSRYRERRR